MAGPRVERGWWGGSVASPSAATGWDGDRLLRGREAGVGGGCGLASGLGFLWLLVLMSAANVWK